MKKYLKQYSEQNPEKFNKEFILSRKNQDILEYVKDIFKALEVLNEIKVESVTIERDEATFGPIKSQHTYYKSILPSRLDKIHYKVRITPSESGEENESFIKEGDIFINKLIDDCFYINEGVRYYLIYQIVDNSTYGTENAVSLKSLLMPITMRAHEITVEPEYLEPPMKLKSFETILFSKSLNPLLYIFAKDSFEIIQNYKVKDSENTYNEWAKIREPNIIKHFNKFFGTDFIFAESLDELETEGRVIFTLKEKGKEQGCYVSVDKEKLKSDELTQNVLGSLLDIKNETKKKKIVFSYDELCTPWFWINTVSAFFTKNNDFLRKFNKIKTMLISLERLIDDTTRKVLNLKERDKKSTLTIMRFILENFEELKDADPKDLDSKRLRLFEYQLYPLRIYLSNQIYRVLNSPTRSKAVLERIFSNLSPMYVIKQTVTSELLRYYNSANEMNIYGALLKYTFRGPQSLNKTVSMEQRDLHPSYVGRLSMVASSASDPGMSGNLTPFIEEYNYFFKKQKGLDK